MGQFFRYENGDPHSHMSASLLTHKIQADIAMALSVVTFTSRTTYNALIKVM